jgi:hypothetical protein
MSVLERVRDSRSGSWLVAAGAYAVATLAAAWLRKASGGSIEAGLAGALIMSASLIVTALVVRGPVFPRWSLFAAAGILGAGMVASVLIAPSEASDSLIGTWTYGWLYLALLGGTRAAGPRWCHSPWVVVGAAGVLSVIGVIAQVL